MDLHGGSCFVGFPLGGSCQQPRPLTDEGQVYGHHPLAGYNIIPAPSSGLGRGLGHLPPPAGEGILTPAAVF